VNGVYLRALAPAELAAAALPFIAKAGLPVPGDDAWLAKALATLQERAKTLIEIVEQARFYLVDHVAIDPAAAAKFLTPEIAPALRSLRDACAAVDEWTAPALESAFQEVLAQHGLKLGKLAQPVRVAVTGTTASPGIFEVLDVLGRDRTVARLDAALAEIR
jgi:glutamyl-tRNA synthetase